MSWPLVKLNIIADVIRGVTFSRKDSSTSYQKNYLPILRAGNIQRELILDHDLVWIPKDKVSAEKIILANDIVMCTSSGSTNLVGKCAQALHDWEGSFGAFCATIRAKKDFCDASYLYYFLSSSVFRNWTQNAAGANIKNIRISELNDFEIPLPSLPEQKQIATILDRADQLRQKRKKSLELADQFLRSVFLEMFGDPVINPKGWKTDKLGNIATKIGSGATPKGGKDSYVDHGISLIRSLNIYDDFFQHDNLAFITDEQAEKLANVIVEEKDVLLNITGASVTRCAIVDKSILPARVNQHVAILRIPELESDYLLYALISKNYKKQLLWEATSGGATREALTKTQLENLVVPIPPKDLQKKFTQVRKKVNSILNKSYQLSDSRLFEALSQKAFKGELSSPSKELHLSDPKDRSTSEELAQLKAEIKEDKEEVKEVIEKIRLPEERLNQELQEIETLFQQSSLAESISVESFQAYLESLVEVLANDENVDQLQLTLDEFSLSFGLTEDLEQELKRIEEEGIDVQQQSSMIDFKDLVSYFIAQNDKKNSPSFSSVITYFNSLGYRGLLVYEQLKTMIFESLKIGWLTQVSQDKTTSIQELNTALDSMISFKIDN